MSPKTMKAVVFYGPGDVRLETIKVPQLQPDWVLLKVHASGICGSDLHLYKEKTSIPIASELGPGRYVAGHELSGEVFETGSNVENLRLGDRVGVEPIVNCGVCDRCRLGWYNQCANYRLIGFQLLGGFAEYCAVPAEKCFPLPGNVSYEEAATLDCIAVAEHATKKAAVSNEDTVAIFGAGTIGLFAAQTARLAGARRIYVIGTHDYQLRAAKRLGATAAINARSERPVERILELTSGEGVDKVIEAVGGESAAISDAVGMLRLRGTLVMTGIFVKPMAVDLFGLLTKELTVTAAWGYEYWTHIKEFAVALDLLAQGRIDAKTLITHKFPLSKVSEAYAAAVDKNKFESIKVQLIPT